MTNISENRRGKFEQAWEDAFDGKEMSPSPELWQNLDRHLANQESKKYRKGIFIYKWVAAASVAIALMVTGIYFYGSYTGQNAQISEVETQGKDIEKLNDGQTDDVQVPLQLSAPTLSDNEVQRTTRPKNNTKNFNDKSVESSLNQLADSKARGVTDTPANTGQSNDPSLGSATTQIAANSAQGTSTLSSNVPQLSDKPVVTKGQLPAGQQPPGGVYDGKDQVTTPLNLGRGEEETFQHIALTEDGKANHEEYPSVLSGKGVEPEYIKPAVDNLVIQKVVNFGDDPFKKKSNKDVFEENLWAGVNFSSGYFDPNFESTNIEPLVNIDDFFFGPTGIDDESMTSQEQISQENSGGQSFAFGVSVGKRIAKRWVLQSGLNYLNYSSNSSTNAFYESSDQTRTPASDLFSVDDTEVLNFSPSPIGFDNQFEFLSIPVQAGYVLVDKKVSVLLSAGVGTDFFLQNNVTPDQEGLEDFSVKPGDDSPYRTVYFNGLMGTQLRYRFSKHYSFTFEPSYSIAINSFSKSDNDLNSFPNVFRIGVGLKYHFK